VVSCNAQNEATHATAKQARDQKAFEQKQAADQAAFQQRTEIEQSAPLLLPLRPSNQPTTVITGDGSVTKRADRLFVDATNLRVVVPVRNVGSGVALIVGFPVRVDNCNSEPGLMKKTEEWGLGTYAVPSGETAQLPFLEQPYYPDVYRFQYKNHSSFDWLYGQFGRKMKIAGRPKKGTTTNDGAMINGRPAGSLSIYYTDAAHYRLRWTCVTYRLAGPGLPQGKRKPQNLNGRPDPSEWEVYTQVFGERQGEWKWVGPTIP
jgi:hypothetical protein